MAFTADTGFVALMVRIVTRSHCFKRRARTPMSSLAAFDANLIRDLHSIDGTENQAVIAEYAVAASFVPPLVCAEIEAGRLLQHGECGDFSVDGTVLVVSLPTDSEANAVYCQRTYLCATLCGTRCQSR